MNALQTLEKEWEQKRSTATRHPLLARLYTFNTLRTWLLNRDIACLVAITLWCGMSFFFIFAVILDHFVQSHQLLEKTVDHILGDYITGVLSCAALWCLVMLPIQKNLEKHAPITAYDVATIEKFMALSPVFQKAISNWYQTTPQLTKGDVREIKKVFQRLEEARFHDEQNTREALEHQILQASLLGVLKERSMLENAIPVASIPATKKHL